MLSYDLQCPTFFCTLRLLARTVKLVVTPLRSDLPSPPPPPTLPSSPPFSAVRPDTSDTSLEVLVEPCRAAPRKPEPSTSFLHVLASNDTLSHEVRSNSTPSHWPRAAGMTLGDVHMLLCQLIILFRSVLYIRLTRTPCAAGAAACTPPRQTVKPPVFAAGLAHCGGGGGGSVGVTLD